MTQTPSSRKKINCYEGHDPGGNHWLGTVWLASLIPDGLEVYCKVCRRPHIITRKALERAWDELNWDMHDKHIDIKDLSSS